MSNEPAPIVVPFDNTNVEQLNARVAKLHETLRLQRGDSMNLYRLLKAEKAENEVLKRKLEATEQINAREVVGLKLSLRTERDLAKDGFKAEIERLEGLKLKAEKDKKVLLALRDTSTEDLIEKYLQLEVETRRKEEELETVYNLMSLYQKDLNEEKEKQKELSKQLEETREEAQRLSRALAEEQQKASLQGQTAADQQKKTSFEIPYCEYLKSKDPHTYQMMVSEQQKKANMESINHTYLLMMQNLLARQKSTAFGTSFSDVLNTKNPHLCRPDLNELVEKQNMLTKQRLELQKTEMPFDKEALRRYLENQVAAAQQKMASSEVQQCSEHAKLNSSSNGLLKLADILVPFQNMGTSVAPKKE